MSIVMSPGDSFESVGEKEVQEGLFLFPLPIAEGRKGLDWFGPECRKLLMGNRLVFAENERTARRFIASLKLGVRIEDYLVIRLDKDSGPDDHLNCIRLLREKGSALLMSEAGCPAIADPGSELVRLCHENAIKVHPLTGPSSLLLALMGSGLSGQRFSFHGYLPVEKNECAQKIRKLEQDSARDACTQLFIETPYRNRSVWEQLLRNLSSRTLLCYARDVGGDAEEIRMKPVVEWKNCKEVQWPKIPCVFLFMAGR